MSKTNKKQKKNKTKSISKERKELEDSNNRCIGGKDRKNSKKRKQGGSPVSDHDRKKVLVKGENKKRSKKKKSEEDDGNVVSVKISGISSTLQLEDKSSRAKKRRKEKKKNKQEYEAPFKQQGVNPDLAADLQDDDTNNENELEGSMISNDVFVLIDQKRRKVYSSTELLQNGERKIVGKVDDNGRVVLFQKELEEENSPPPTQGALTKRDFSPGFRLRLLSSADQNKIRMYRS